MKTLEERVERCVNDFTKKLSKALIRKEDGGNNGSISYLVQRQWNVQMKESFEKAPELTPLYANAIVAMREKAAELAPEFLERYRHHLEHPEGAQRFLRPVFEQYFREFIFAMSVSAVIYGAMVLSAQYITRTPLSDALILSSSLLLAVAIQEYATMPNSRARQERRSFEVAVKSEFYRAARSS